MTEDRLNREEISLIIRETKSLNAEHKTCVGKVLSKKKAKGIKIDAQAIAIALKECGQSREQKSKNRGYNWENIPSKTRPVVKI